MKERDPAARIPRIEADQKTEEVWEIIRLFAGPGRHWNDEERVLLHATDQIAETADLDDATWRQLSAFLDRRQIMDFLFTVGAYVLLGQVCNALRIEREDELLALAERYGAPEMDDV